jgi:L-lactate dehydrogenase complex protein LldE
VIDAVDPEAGMSASRVLERAGCAVDIAEGATCCGQPAWNAGHADAAAKVARTTLEALAAAGSEAVVVPAGSCATMMRVFWQELFEIAGTAEDRAKVAAVAAKTYEMSEFLAGRDTPSTTRPDPTPTVYHRSCHMSRELGIVDQPETLLDATGADRRATTAQDRCCGFGGLFSVKLPEVSVAMADDVLDAAVATGAKRVVGCDASCLMHLEGRSGRRGLDLEFRHLAQVLDTATEAR